MDFVLVGSWEPKVSIELSVPRTRYGNFYPILLSIIKDQQGEMEQLSFLLSTQGLTMEQIGEVFEQLYAHHYSKESISRLAQRAHQEVLDWLERPLDPHYPIVYIDCIFVPLRRGSTVSREAIYTHPGGFLQSPPDLPCPTCQSGHGRGTFAPNWVIIVHF